MTGTTLAVEMGETRVSRGASDRMVAHGLGACVSLCLYDIGARLAAMVHVVLPETVPLKNFGAATQPFVPPPGRCADTAVRHALEQIVSMGAIPERIRAAIIGGAHIFSHATGADKGSQVHARLEIGPRNVAAVRAALAAEQIPLIAEDVGGNYGRSITFCVGTGDLYVRRIGAEETLLAALGKTLDALPSDGKEAAHAGH